MLGFMSGQGRTIVKSDTFPGYPSAAVPSIGGCPFSRKPSFPPSRYLITGSKWPHLGPSGGSMLGERDCLPSFILGVSGP